MSPLVFGLILAAAALHATWNGLIKSGPDRYLDMVALLTAAGVLTAVWLPFLPLPARASWPFLAASAIIHQVYFALIAQSYRTGQMSLVYPVTRGTAPALTALAAVLVLKDHLSPGTAAGVALVSAGVLVMAGEQAKAAAFPRTPLLLALANGCVIVLYTLVDGAGVRLSHHAFSYTSWGFLLCGLLFTPTAILLRGRAVVTHFRDRWRESVMGAGCSIASYSLALWAMTSAPIPTVAALREVSIVFGVLLAAWKLKESVSPLRVAAVAGVFVGVVLIKLG